MSLFKAREFWSTQNDTDEIYDRDCLRIHPLNSDSDFILIGSHSGFLQIFKPSTDITEENNIVGYKPSDLCLEMCLDYPVLQIEVGKLVSGSPLSQIAILHPLTISVYSYTSKDGNVEHGQQIMLNLLYEHKLRRYSANFVIGTFGGSKQREFLCIQSLDGMLSFFEQETFGFDCVLPNFLIPGPLLYCSKSDSFITFSSNWNIESFSYKMLSEMSVNKNSSTGLKVEPDWGYNISEEILQINCLINAESEANICYLVLLGDRHLHCITENGHIKFMKKLGYSPNCISNYILDEDKIFSLIISETNTLLIYHNTTLKWSAQLSFLPISISRVNLKNIKGALTFLSENGRLQCVYLGTEPFLFSAPPLTNQQIDFEKTEEELSKLYKVIANNQNKDNKYVNATTERELIITILINPHLQTEENENAPKKCKVLIEIMPQAIFEEINVVIYVEKPLKALPNSEFYTNITDRVQFESDIYHDEEINADLATLDLILVVTVISSTGVPRVVQKSATLPLNLAILPCPPCKENEHKITLNINDSPVAISTLFPEFIGDNAITISSNATGFVNSSGSIVTLLAAKSSQRYRLQSDSICALNLLVQEVIRRLMKHYTSQKHFLVTYTGTLPVAQVIDKVREHFEARIVVKKCEDDLGQLSAQFRLIQKRLISKYKDKNPTPMNNLDMLLQDTYQENCDLVTKLEESTKKLKLAQINLTCILHLIQTLLNISDKIQDNQSDIIEKSPIDNMLSINGNKKSPTDNGPVKVTEVSLVTSALCCHVNDCSEQSWEDVSDAGMCYLLRTKLAKSEKDKLRAPHTSFEEIRDLLKVEKHIGQIFERIVNLDKANLSIKEDDESVQKDDTAAVPSTSQIETEQQINRLVPVGSTFAESSTRALSARKSLLRRRQNIQD